MQPALAPLWPTSQRAHRGSQAGSTPRSHYVRNRVGGSIAERKHEALASAMCMLGIPLGVLRGERSSTAARYCASASLYSPAAVVLHRGARLTACLLYAASWGLFKPPQPAPQCFEEDCRGSPFLMHASRTVNLTGSSQGVAVCFAFVAIGCWAAPKGCCPMVARKFRALEFAVSE
jgi:hypothetical protein